MKKALWFVLALIATAIAIGIDQIDRSGNPWVIIFSVLGLAAFLALIFHDEVDDFLDENFDPLIGESDEDD